MKAKKIIIVHYRTGERDGVSLEIEKRREVLKGLGNKVMLITGYDPRNGSDKDIFRIPQLDIKRRLASVLRETFFFHKILDDHLAWLIYHSEEEKIYKQFSKIIEHENPDLIFIHNIMSTAYHLPATTAILKALDRHPVSTVCIYHDFWWERTMFYKTRYSFISDIIKSLPPKKNYIIKHQVINSLTKLKLLDKTNIVAENIGDYFDFNKKLAELDEFNSDFLSSFGIKKGELVVLHSTRIVKRKAIENAIVFTAKLQKEIGIKVNLLLPNFIEVEAEIYFKKLKNLAAELKVNFIWIGDRIQLDRKISNGLKFYSFWDCYLFADLMTYTSYAEGFGNQLLEAFWSRKLPVLFEYPVFRSDIKKEGYGYVSLGNKMYKRGDFYFVNQEQVNEAVKQTINFLQNKEKLNKLTNNNFWLAKKNHDVSHLKNNLLKLF